MTLTRLLAATLLVSSLPAFAQEITRKSDPHPTPVMDNQSSHDAPPATTPRNTELFAVQSADPGSTVNALDPSRLDQYRYDQVKGERHEAKNPFTTKASGMPERQEADVNCLRIRSYVVARDSRDSDATHPVSYSTCQPAERYGLKTTEMRTTTGGR